MKFRKCSNYLLDITEKGAMKYHTSCFDSVNSRKKWNWSLASNDVRFVNELFKWLDWTNSLSFGRSPNCYPDSKIALGQVWQHFSSEFGPPTMWNYGLRFAQNSLANLNQIHNRKLDHTIPVSHFARKQPLLGHNYTRRLRCQLDNSHNITKPHIECHFLNIWSNKWQKRPKKKLTGTHLYDL